MEGLGISTVSSSSKSTKRSNGDAKLKGKQQAEPPTTYTVSKIDAGQAVLISDQVCSISHSFNVYITMLTSLLRLLNTHTFQIHCIEFPSILLPPGCTTGSVVSISCTRNHKEEQRRNDDFWDLQDEILSAFGERSPAPPRLRLRNVTQTSVTLEWDRLDLATSKLLSLTIWRNGQRLAAIPNPLNNTSTKVSGLDVDAPYSFHLIMRTTAGTYASQTIKTRTLTLADTSGIAVCFGAITPPELLEEAKEALTQMRARWSSKIQIETTHFVCTQPNGPAPAVTPPLESPREAPDPGAEYQRASQLSIPIVQPAWIMACLREKRMVPISAYTLDKAILSGGPSSSASLVKNASTRSPSHAAQQARDGPREPIQLQKPPAPKHASPEVPSSAPLPEADHPASEDVRATSPPPQVAATESEQAAATGPPSSEDDSASHDVPEEVKSETTFETDLEKPQGVTSPTVETVDKGSTAEPETETNVVDDIEVGPTETPLVGTTSVEDSAPVMEVALQQLEEVDDVNEDVEIQVKEDISSPVASSAAQREVAESFQSASEESQPSELTTAAEQTPVLDEEEDEDSASATMAVAPLESDEALSKEADETETGESDTETAKETLEEVKL